MTTKLFNFFLAFKLLLQDLWSSVISVKFYQDVYSVYKGYGIKYIFTISFISSIFFCIFILQYIIDIKTYFQENLPSKGTANIDYILKQLPDINYDGKDISLQNDSPLYLYDLNNKKVAIIDPSNQVHFNEKSQIPIILTNKDIIISVIQTTSKKISTFPIAYRNIFGLEPQLLTNDIIKKDLGILFDSIPRLFIYIIMPILIIIRFLTILIEKSFIILLIYLFTNFITGPTTTMQTCIRLVLFSSGAMTILQPIIILIFPILSEFIWLIQMWCYSLIFLALLKIRSLRL